MTYEAATTTLELRKLRALSESGLSLMAAADEMEWGFNRVQYWEQKLGICFKRGIRRYPISNRQLERLKKCAEAGMPINETAELMGWPYRRVWRYAQRLGLQFRRLKHKP